MTALKDTFSSFAPLLLLNDTLIHFWFVWYWFHLVSLELLIAHTAHEPFRGSCTLFNATSSSTGLLKGAESNWSHPRAQFHVPNGALRPPGNTYFLVGITTYTSHLSKYILRLLAPQYLVPRVKAKVCWPSQTSFRALQGLSFRLQQFPACPFPKAWNIFFPDTRKVLPKAKTYR